MNPAEKNSEYTKMSIHCHLGGATADCTIDSPITFQPTFNLNDAYSKIDKAANNDFHLLAQTNSNTFDAASWILCRRYASLKGIELLPGVEINLENWETDGLLHVVVVFPPTINAYKLQDDLRKKYEANEKFSLTLSALCELLINSRAIICVHGIKQDERNLRDNPQMARDIIGFNRFFPVSFEDNREFHKTVLVEAIKGFLNDSQVEWLEKDAADISTSDRQEFDKIPSPTYIWAGNTFEDLYYCVLTGASRIVREENIVTRPSYIAKIVIDEKSQMKTSELDCSQGLNCIIGPSGSGKTLLLDMLKLKMTGKHIQEKVSNSGDYQNMYDASQIHLLDPSGKELDKSFGFEVIEGENLYQKVIHAYQGDRSDLIAELGLEVNDEKYSKLIQEFEEKANTFLRLLKSSSTERQQAEASLAQAKSATTFIEANEAMRSDVISYNIDSSIMTKLEHLGSLGEQCVKDRSESRLAFKTLENIAKRLSFPDDLQQELLAIAAKYEALLTKKEADVKREISSLAFTQAKQQLIYSSSQQYNSQVSLQFQQVNEKKQLVSDKLEELARHLLALKEMDLKLSAPTIKSDEVKNSIRLNSNNAVTRLKIRKMSTSLPKDALKSTFPGNIATRTPGKAQIKLFDEQYDLSNESDVEKLLSVFFSEDISSDLTVSLPPDQLIEYSVELCDETGEFRPIDEFSAGMLSKVYVSHFLDTAISNAGSNTIVLYDQPESNMEKEFLIETLANKFAELRKSHQIFVATHEPLLVVNADANEIILASNDKKVNQPNRIGYENRSFVGAHGKSHLIEDVARLIDGGTRAVRRRSEVYEGMKG